MPSIAIIGAGPQMGLAIARTFGSQGFDVALISRNREKLDGLVGKLTAEDITAAAFPADAFMADCGRLDEAYREDLDNESAALAAEIRRVCRELPLGDITGLFGSVLAEETPLLAEERRQYEALVASYAD